LVNDQRFEINLKLIPISSGFFLNVITFAKKMMTPKPASESLTILTDLVLPSETNPLNNLFGGELLARMDRAASIAARRHSRRITVTASVNHVAFNRAIPLGSVVTVEAKISRSFKSSMEIFLDVWVEDRESGNRTKANEAIYTFVAVDDTGRPVEVAQVIPETDLEKERFEAALRRKQLSLVLAGKMKPQEATELRALFM
jgi:acyl-CoA hydrolase